MDKEPTTETPKRNQELLCVSLSLTASRCSFSNLCVWRRRAVELSEALRDLLQREPFGFHNTSIDKVQTINRNDPENRKGARVADRVDLDLEHGRAQKVQKGAQHAGKSERLPPHFKWEHFAEEGPADGAEADLVAADVRQEEHGDDRLLEVHRRVAVVVDEGQRHDKQRDDLNGDARVEKLLPPDAIHVQHGSQGQRDLDDAHEHVRPVPDARVAEDEADVPQHRGLPRHLLQRDDAQAADELRPILHAAEEPHQISEEAARRRRLAAQSPQLHQNVLRRALGDLDREDELQRLGDLVVPPLEREPASRGRQRVHPNEHDGGQADLDDVDLHPAVLRVVQEGPHAVADEDARHDEDFSAGRHAAAEKRRGHLGAVAGHAMQRERLANAVDRPPQDHHHKSQVRDLVKARAKEGHRRAQAVQEGAEQQLPAPAQGIRDGEGQDGAKERAGHRRRHGTDGL
eukprot:scaffold309_cov235-Pinguiococcus_pyrenoidosus.AAC.17